MTDPSFLETIRYLDKVLAKANQKVYIVSCEYCKYSRSNEEDGRQFFEDFEGNSICSECKNEYPEWFDDEVQPGT